MNIYQCYWHQCLLWLFAGLLPSAHGFHKGSPFITHSVALPSPRSKSSLIHNGNAPTFNHLLYQQQNVIVLQSTSSRDTVEEKGQEKKSRFIQELWPLLLLSLLSGIPSSCRQIAESHVSRMPDCPIAHDIDTLLLWPAIPMSLSSSLPPTIFQTPAAAITQVDKYTVNWDLVTKTYFDTVAYSLSVSTVIALGLWWLMFTTSENDVMSLLEKDERKE